MSGRRRRALAGLFKKVHGRPPSPKEMRRVKKDYKKNMQKRGRTK